MISQHFKSISLLVISIFLSAISIHAQIGYQVSLLNTATGEPRANERVTAKIELSNCDNDVVYSETQTGVTNEFGVLSLTIGNETSLANIDWSKYPMFISVTIDNVLIGKTQVMSVPYANALVPLSKEVLIGMWSGYGVEGNEIVSYSISFFQNGECNIFYSRNGNFQHTGFYDVQGNTVYCMLNCSNENRTEFYELVTLRYFNGKLYASDIYEGNSPAFTKQN